MNYIINPAWFYWVNVAEALKIVAVVCTLLFGAATIVWFCIAATNYDYGVEDEDYKRAKRALKVLLPFFVFSALALIFIPDKNTLIEMQVAKFATYENAEWTVDTLKSAVDYIVEAIKSLK